MLGMTHRSVLSDRRQRTERNEVRYACAAIAAPLVQVADEDSEGGPGSGR